MLTLIGGICLLLFFVFMCNKKVAMLFLQGSFIVMLLFLINIIVNKMGVAIPINFFTIMVIMLLRVPGVICIVGLIFLKVFL